ncbi:hypothetical protein NQ318_022192 [Aromia moschata]|uniref:ubiquitinyl hydrolase 1 n=1 Tax=Aromia moschata TaxID=1265417 RepID=A0AAV8Z5M3_9CUCU|nr:hypothetical protein NQ318_022192 [Aromia moschata]
MSDVCNIEFLDLSGVDENEQIRLRESLQHSDSSLQLPWVDYSHSSSFDEIKQNRNGKPNDIVKNIPNHDYDCPIASLPYQNQQFCQSPPAPSQSVPSAHYPANPTSFFSATSPPFGLIPPSICTPSRQITSAALSTAIRTRVIPSPGPSRRPTRIPPTTCQIPQITQQQQVHEYVPQQGYGNGVAYPAIEQRIETVDKDYAAVVPQQHEAAPSEKENLAEDPIQQHARRRLCPVLLQSEQNGIKNKPEKEALSSPGWGSKSWASLFNSSNPSNGVSDQATEEIAEKAALSKAANEKPNNNGALCPIKHPKKSHFVDPDCYRMGEFLTSHTVDGRTVSLQPRGLINHSNYCYINSILQALVACPPLYNLLISLAQNISSNEKRKPTPVIDGMCRFVKEFKQLPANMRVNNRRSDGKNQKKEQGILINTDIPFEPFWIHKMLNGIRTDLIEGRQEDAEEFLGCLLNGLNDEMLELMKLIRNDCDEKTQIAPDLEGDSDADKEWQVMGPKNKGSVTRRTDFGRTPISDIFGGHLRSRIHRTGDHVTENIQPFFTLQLNIEKVKTVREALEALVTKNQLEGLTSSKTNEEVEAWQQVMLDELPVVLVLHLKCFDFKLDGCKKIIKAPGIPDRLENRLDWQEQCVGYKPIFISELLASSKTHQMPKEKQYKLFAVVYHDGKEASKGHYVTDAFHVGYSSWLRYDDASVKPVVEEHVLRPQGTRVPYLLFYRRSDTIRSK